MNNLNRTNKNLTGWFSLPWYFIAFSAYPVLSLLSFNVGQVSMGTGWRPLLASVLFAGFLFMLLKLLLRDADRAAFLSTLWLVLFFSYGHIFMILAEKWEDASFMPWLPAVWLSLAVLFTIWATRPRWGFRDAALPLNVISIGLVVTSLVQLGIGVQGGDDDVLGAKNAPVQNLERPKNPPDVYYFILDSYGRDDLLRQVYGYDNSAFTDGLRKRGFYIASCSQSNYVRTEISVASSLNMAYLQGLDPSFTAGSTFRNVLWESLKHSATRFNFERMGYTTIGFATGFAWNELEDADVYFTPESSFPGLTEFEILLMRTTFARHAVDLGWIDTDKILGQHFRDRTMNVFDRIDDIARMSAPTFAYIHLISPHPPFVFGPNGEPTDPSDFWNEDREYPSDLYARGYQNQLTFLNKMMLKAVDLLLSNSPTPPLIIIQGDHGPWLQPTEKRFLILNAYYLPGQKNKLYPSISPVNTFRVVFNSYFGGRYDMLSDVSYFSPVPKLYAFSKVAGTCRPVAGDFAR